MKILLLGSNGQVGWQLRRSLSVVGDVTALHRGSAPLCGDLARPDALAQAIRTVAPDVIVNAAAYTAVDRAETERELAEAVNSRGPELIAAEARKRRVLLVHFGTDYVFGGASASPYEEDDPVAPLNAYGESKLHGEQAVLASGVRSLVIRTQWLFGTAGKSFPRTMWERATSGLQTQVVSDQIGRPTYTRDLAMATWRLVDKNASGIVHVTNGGAATSWYEFAREVFIRAGAETLLSPCTTAAYPTPARRPAYSVLSTRRLEQLLGAPLPHWREGLARFLDEITSAAT